MTAELDVFGIVQKVGMLDLYAAKEKVDAYPTGPMRREIRWVCATWRTECYRTICMARLDLRDHSIASSGGHPQEPNGLVCSARNMNV